MLARQAMETTKRVGTYWCFFICQANVLQMEDRTIFPNLIDLEV
jgi:hypothetical protein